MFSSTGQDILEYRTSSHFVNELFASESPFKISDVPSTSNKQGYGSTLNEDVNLNKNKNQDEKKKQKRPRVVRSDSSVSRKSDKLINEVNRDVRAN